MTNILEELYPAVKRYNNSTGGVKFTAKALVSQLVKKDPMVQAVLKEAQVAPAFENVTTANKEEITEKQSPVEEVSAAAAEEGLAEEDVEVESADAAAEDPAAVTLYDEQLSKVFIDMMVPYLPLLDETSRTVFTVSFQSGHIIHSKMLVFFLHALRKQGLPAADAFLELLKNALFKDYRRAVPALQRYARPLEHFQDFRLMITFLSTLIESHGAEAAHHRTLYSVFKKYLELKGLIPETILEKIIAMFSRHPESAGHLNFWSRLPAYAILPLRPREDRPRKDISRPYGEESAKKDIKGPRGSKNIQEDDKEFAARDSPRRSHDQRNTNSSSHPFSNTDSESSSNNRNKTKNDFGVTFFD